MSKLDAFASRTKQHSHTSLIDLIHFAQQIDFSPQYFYTKTYIELNWRAHLKEENEYMEN